MSAASTAAARRSSGAGTQAWALLVGLTAGLVGFWLGGMHVKHMAAGVLSLGLVSAAMLSRQTSRMILVAMILTLGTRMLGKAYGLSVIFPWLLHQPGAYFVDPLAVFLVVGCLLWLRDVVLLGVEALPRRPVGIVPLCLLFCFAALAAGRAFVPSQGFYDLLRVAQYMVFFVYLTARIRDDADLRVVLLAVAAVTFLESALVFYQFFHGANLQLTLLKPTTGPAATGALEAASRYVGAFPHPNGLATFMAMLIPILLVAVLVLRRDRIVRAACLTALLAAAGAAGLTLSRGLLVSLPVGIAVAFLVVRGRGGFSREHRQRALAVLLVAAVPVVLSAPKFYERFTSDYATQAGVAHYHTMGVAARVIKAHPLTGVGLDGYRRHLKTLSDRPGDESASIEQYVVEKSPAQNRWAAKAVPHCLYLQIAAELGIPGLIAFVWFMLVVMRTGWRARHRGTELERALRGGGLAGLCCYAFYVLYQAGPLMAGPGFWFLVAIAAHGLSPYARPTAMPRATPVLPAPVAHGAALSG